MSEYRETTGLSDEQTAQLEQVAKSFGSALRDYLATRAKPTDGEHLHLTITGEVPDVPPLADAHCDAPCTMKEVN